MRLACVAEGGDIDPRLFELVIAARNPLFRFVLAPVRHSSDEIEDVEFNARMAE
jgi:hypothetical protein